MERKIYVLEVFVKSTLVAIAKVPATNFEDAAARVQSLVTIREEKSISPVPVIKFE